MNISTQQLRPISTGIGALAVSILTACGGGNSSGGSSASTGATSQVAGISATTADTAETAQSATVKAQSVASLAEVAPAPDSASINGVSLTAQKALGTSNRVQASSAMIAKTAAVSAPSEIADLVLAATTKVRTPAVPNTDPTLVNIYVSPSGNDAWTGSLAAANAGATDGPVKTLAAAQAVARTKLAAMNTSGTHLPVHVKIAAGNYYLTAPLQFTPADSGTASAIVYYEAVTPGTVLVSGGAPLSPSSIPAATGQVRFNVPAAAGTAYSGGSQLYVNNRRAVLARQPNAGNFWFVKSAVPVSTESSSDAGHEAFTTSPEATAWVNSLGASDRSRATVQVMQAYVEAHLRLSSQAAPQSSIRVSRLDSQFLDSGPSQRFFVENVAAALDAPSEWLWDANGVSYIPAADENTSTLDAVMPVLDKLVVMTGDVGTANWVQNIWFTGINFAHTRYLLPTAGVNTAQAGMDVGAAIEMDGAVGVVIDNCNISHTGGFAVWMRRAVRDSRITNSIMTDLGGGGVKLGMPYQPLNELPSGANSAVGNQIIDTGKYFTGAVGVWIGQSFDNLVANNAIFNTTYSGISMGWTWGYGTATSGRNRILNNLLTNIGQAQLSDMGGIYSVGVSPGSTISGNVIREVRGYPGYGPGAWGIYNDEGSSNMLVENNMVVGTDSGGYHLHYGRDNTVRSNLFALGTKFEMRLTTTDPLVTKLVFSDNLLIPLVQQPFDSYARAPDVIFTNDLVSAVSFGGTLNLSMCGTPCSLSTAKLTTGADPRSLSLSGIDSATVSRFATIAASSGPASLVSAATVAAVPAAPIAVVVAPPTAVELNIAGTAIGAQPGGLVYIPYQDTSAISVKADSTAPNGKCISYNDSGLFEYSYYPYTYTSLNHDRGTSTAEFTIKIDANTSMGYEWRDGGNPYKTGPAFQISPAGVVFRGQNLGPAPIGTWLTIKVVAPVDNPSGTWSIDVTNGTTGVKTSTSNIAFASAGWSNLAWLGLMSGATTTSAACLGSLKITSSIQ